MGISADSADLEMYVVYTDSTDYLDEYIARKWVVRGDECDEGKVVFRSSTLAGVREQLPAGLTRIPREPDDAPSVIECWF